MATYTENYQLHQWVPEDDFLRTDFNTDFQKIDTALAGIQEAVDGKTRIREGSYTGNGSTSLRTVATSGTPKVLLLSTGSSVFAVLDNGKTVNRVTVINNGFRIEAGSGDPNQSGKTYHFAAFL